MPIYEFSNQFSLHSLYGPVGGPDPRSEEGLNEIHPNIDFDISASQQRSDVGGRTDILRGNTPSEPIEIHEFLEPGFHYLDTGMKDYFGDIRIPSKDSVRFLRTKVAGMRRGIEAWSADLKHGRVALPVISISRTTHSYNPEKFSPPHHPMRIRYIDGGRHRAKLTWRPVPWLVEYTLTIWAESKRDAEYAVSQILTRYNPLAEFRVSDQHITGTVTLRYGSLQDSSDKEATPEQLAKIKYELTTTAEAWLSLPEQVVPTILGAYGGIKMGQVLEPWDRLRVGAANG